MKTVLYCDKLYHGFQFVIVSDAVLIWRADMLWNIAETCQILVWVP